MDIYKRSLVSLEWDKLKDYLSWHCETEAGKNESLAVELHDHLSIVQSLLAETEEAHSLLVDKSLPSLANFPDISSTLERIGAGAPLNVMELLHVRAVLLLARSVRSSMSLLSDADFPFLTKWVRQLRLVESVKEAIELAIDAHGNVRDEASTELKDLRLAHGQIKDVIKEKLANIIHSSEYSKALQEPLITQRNGRYVLPVNASMRTAFPGIVHDSSASGLTVYVEPTSIIGLSNDLRLKEADIEREIEHILSILSGYATEHYDEIFQTYRVIIELDKIFARARLGSTYGGTIPSVADDSNLQLYNARHPLLILQNFSREVIGNDITLSVSSNFRGDQGQTLIITGPNTGGKTVLLKTLGLLAIMVRAGLMLPVKSGSHARIFKEIFADIGDEQSLEQSLSTFSGHLLNIKQIVEQAGTQSLVLLDEIGAGTDPREGAALAQAILEQLHQLGAWTVVTTHLSELKAMGYANGSFVNASFAFDAVNLVPTYKLLIGIPGSSQAITIAQCLGLNQSIVDRTNELLKNSKDVLQQSVDAVERQMSELRQSKEKARANELKADELCHSYESKLQRLASESQALQQDYASKLAGELDHSRKVIRELTAELQKQPSLAKAQSAQLQLQSIKDEVKRFKRPTAEIGDLGSLEDLTAGQIVFIASINQTAVIEEVPKDFQKQSNPIIQLRAGNVRIRVPLSDLRSLGKTSVAKDKVKSRRKSLQNPSNLKSNRLTMSASSQSAIVGDVFVRSASNTLDLRGQRVENALILLASFLDTSIHNSITPLMVIHGHGTGALKAAVRQELLNANIEFRPGDSHEGGDGVTLISLR